MHTFKQLLICIVVPMLAIAGLAACAPLRVLNVLASASTGHSVSRDVAYGTLSRQRLDIYTPTTPAPAGGWPVVVFFHGGSWNSGERADYAFVGAALASRAR